MKKLNLFNFLGSKVDLSDIAPEVTQAATHLAFEEAALHIGITYIANALSKCEIKTFKNGKEHKGLMYYRLNVSPNPNQNASQFINKLINRYFRDKEGALVLMINDYLYVADSFTIDDSRPLEGYLYENVTIDGLTLSKKYKASEVFHFRLNDKSVKSYIDGMYQQYGIVLSLALETFKKKNSRKYKVLMERAQAGDQQHIDAYTKYVTNQVKPFLEADGTAILPEYRDRKLEEFSIGSDSGSTADIVAMRKEVFETTAQLLHIPLPMMYGNITNLNEVAKVFLSLGVDPHGDVISEEFTRKHFSMTEWQRGSSIMVDTSCINYVDILDVADKVDKAISSGVVNIDELRERLRYQALDTPFSQAHFMTKNYDLAENLLKQLTAKGGE